MRAEILAGGGASTQSRARRPLPAGWHPMVISRSGCSEVWQVETDDGRSFYHKIDVSWPMCQGGGVLGYTGPENRWTDGILRTVDTYADKLMGPGSVASLPEIRAAELLVETVGPFIRDKNLRVRWFANGSDACDAAIRLARYATGRDGFISVGYHGCSVIFAHSPQNGGIPKNIAKDRRDVDFGDTRALVDGAPAAVIVEVPSIDDGAQAFLADCRELCDKTGAILILDEVVTGFRLRLGGAAEYYGIIPDLVCYGKAMSNGRNIAALVGRAELMDPLADKVFHSATYNGDPYNCAHVIGTLWALGDHKDEVYPHLWNTGENLKAAMADIGISVLGHGTRTFIDMPEDERRIFCAEMVCNGIVMDRPNYISMCHGSREIDLTVAAARKVAS